MTFIERLQYFMEHFGINDNQLTVDAGLSVGLIGKAKKTGKAMNSSNIEKILTAYPELNPEWLMLGSGEMIREVNPMSDDERERMEFLADAMNPYSPTNNLYAHAASSNGGDSTTVLLKIIEARDKTVKEQSEQIANLREDIGGLKARIKQLEKELQEARDLAPTMGFDSSVAESVSQPELQST